MSSQPSRSKASLRYDAVLEEDDVFDATIEAQGYTSDLLLMVSTLTAEIIARQPIEQHAALCRMFGHAVAADIERVKERQRRELTEPAEGGK